MNISDWRDERVHPYRLDPREEPEPDVDDEPTGIGARLPATAIAVKRRVEEAALEHQRARIVALRPSGPMPRVRRNRRPARHPGLASPGLAWWCGLLDNLAEWPVADNDNDPEAPSLAAVMDRNPKLDAAETLMRQLPAPIRVATRILRKRHDTSEPAPEVRYIYEWHPDDAEFVEYVADGFSWDEERIRGFRIAKTFRRPSRIGPFRFATARGKGTQFTRVKGQDKAVPVPIYLGSITHEYGRRVGQDNARNRPEESARAVTERAESLRWFCSTLGAVPARPPKLTRRRKGKSYSPAQSQRMIDEAIANTPAMPPVTRFPPGLPLYPVPSSLFVGIVSGMSASDGARSQVRRQVEGAYTQEDLAADTDLRERFRDLHPEHASILDLVASARAFGDLAASNDNGTGKRALARATAALEIFLAA